MTGNQALAAAIQTLRAAGIADPAGDARRLLAYAMTVAPDRLTLHLADPLAPDTLVQFDALLTRRIARQPVSQIVGTRLFWGRAFRVTPAVLDPRPETECLIAAALREPWTSVLDLGTGSGCILLTLLLEAGRETTGLGVDLSPDALLIADQNRATHHLGNRAALAQGSWFTPVSRIFDLIVSNPPYIAADEIDALAPEVRDWEPRMALTPGGDGLDAYRAIAAGAPAHLAQGGRLIVEIGPAQGAAVTRVFTDAGFAHVTLEPDLDGRDRVLVARQPAQFHHDR